MKVAIFFFCVLALACAEKRFLLDTIFNGAEVHSLVDSVVDAFGTDATEQQCEQECVKISTNDLLDMGCDFACKGIQGLIHRLHSKTTAAHSKTTAAHSKTTAAHSKTTAAAP